MTRPDAICCNCFAVWKAAKPRPSGPYCWHSGTVARPQGDGWQIEQASGKAALEQLRREGIR